MIDDVCPGDVKTIKEASIHGQFTKSEPPDGGKAEFIAPVVWAPRLQWCGCLELTAN